MTADNLRLTSEVEPPPECGHKDWTLGCPRCFFEAVGLAKGNMKVAPNDEQLAAAQVEGAILYNWHLLMVLKDVEMQIAPLTRQMDIQRSSIALSVLAQVRKLSQYMVTVVQSPTTMATVLREASALAMQVQEHLKAEDEGRAPTPEAKRKSLITITD